MSLKAPKFDYAFAHPQNKKLFWDMLIQPFPGFASVPMRGTRYNARRSYLKYRAGAALTTESYEYYPRVLNPLQRDRRGRFVPVQSDVTDEDVKHLIAFENVIGKLPGETQTEYHSLVMRDLLVDALTHKRFVEMTHLATFFGSNSSYNPMVLGPIRWNNLLSDLEIPSENCVRTSNGIAFTNMTDLVMFKMNDYCPRKVYDIRNARLLS